MRRAISSIAILALTAAPTAVPSDGAQPDSYKAEHFATCSACHLADGVGLPGAFPPIRNRVASIAGLDGGRKYLIAVVSTGLAGNIEVAGADYFGIMPGSKGSMSAAEIALALNYAMFELVDDKSGRVIPDRFTSSEVEAAQAAVGDSGPDTTAEMRDELVRRNGDRWP